MKGEQKSGLRCKLLLLTRFLWLVGVTVAVADGVAVFSWLLPGFLLHFNFDWSGIVCLAEFLTLERRGEGGREIQM